MKKHKYKLDEASLNRAYQHVLTKKVPSWGMITAYRYANDKHENQLRNKQLESDLRKLGYGFFKVEGHWQECQDENLNYIDCPEDEIKDSIEESFFVPGIRKSHIRELCRKYQQDAVVYGDKTTNSEAHLLFKNGGETSIGKFHTGKVEQAFSKIKGEKTFVFRKRKEEEEEEKNNADADVQKKKSNDKSYDMSLKNLVPPEIANKRIKNPDTGRLIKIKSALGYNQSEPVNKLAKRFIRANNKK